MNKDEFDNYLALITRILRLTRTQSDAIGDEFRDHLESRVAELIDSGESPADAKRRALEEFGDAASLAKQLNSVLHTYRRRWMMRFTTFAIAGSFLVVVLAFSLWPDGARFGTPSNTVAQEGDTVTTQDPDETTTASVATLRTQETLQILEQEATLDYDETPFIDVMDYITEKHGINVILDQSARDDSLTFDEIITFRCRNVRLTKALELMLKDKNATFVVNEGILVIISRDVASDPEYFERRVINVRSLLKQIKSSESARLNAAKNNSNIQIVVGGRFVGGGGGGGGFGGGGGVFQVQDTGKQTAKSNEQIVGQIGSSKDSQTITLKGPITVIKNPPESPENMLIDLIKTTVDADGWDDTNGDGTMSILGGLIVLHNTRAVNDQVQDLVNDLEHEMSR